MDQLTKNDDKMETEQDKEKFVFTKRSKLARTPPTSRDSSYDSLNEKENRRRSFSVSVQELRSSQNMNEAEVRKKTPEQANKRKRSEKTPADKISDSNTLVSTLKHSFKQILREVRKLELVVKEMYKPKQEVKDIAQTMGELVEQISEDDIDIVLGGITSLTEQKLQDENQTLRDKLLQITANYSGSVNSTDIQCPDCKRIREKTLKRRALKTEETYENFQQITEEDWLNELFPYATEVNRPIWEASFEEDLILPCNPEFKTNNRMVSSAINKFGGRGGLMKQGKVKGEVAMMVYTLGFPDTEGNITRSSRGIFYPIVKDGETSERDQDEAMFKALKELKGRLLNGRCTKLAIPEIEDISGVIFRRMIEYLLEDTEIEVKVYKMPKQAQPPKVRPNIIPPETKGKDRKRTKNDGLIVQMKDKTFAELLKTVKQTINPEEIGVDIVDITKTRKGDLLLKVGNGPAKAEELRENMKEKLPGVTASLLHNNKTIHIRGMDETATEAEIRAAIGETMSLKEDSFKLSALRPAYGGKKNITVIMAEKDAERFLEMKTIRIGWMSCKIKERIAETRCYKCWAVGHTKANCSGPDREALCLKCTQPGHKALNCPNIAHCLDCKQDGHQTGTARCPANK